MFLISIVSWVFYTWSLLNASIWHGKTKMCFAFTIRSTVLHRDSALLLAVPQQGSLVLACAYLPLDTSWSSLKRAFLSLKCNKRQVCAPGQVPMADTWEVALRAASISQEQLCLGSIAILVISNPGNQYLTWICHTLCLCHWVDSLPCMQSDISMRISHCKQSPWNSKLEKQS